MTLRLPAKFPLGKVVTTPAALASLSDAGQSPTQFLDRHVIGDWGECCQEDQESNDDAVRHGERVLSAYRTLKGVKIWIITEADRSSTCLLLPEEY